jgi:hypothetical protein
LNKIVTSPRLSKEEDMSNLTMLLLKH